VIPIDKAQKAANEGYAFPCTMCVHLHEGRDRGLTKDGVPVCVAGFEGRQCGGPLSGLAFPEYKGPLTIHAIATHCFRCGKKANKIVEGNRGPGYVGVCNRHLPTLGRVMETGADPWAPVDHVVKP
jgi:hypothetical protein